MASNEPVTIRKNPMPMVGVLIVIVLVVAGFYLYINHPKRGIGSSSTSQSQGKTDTISGTLVRINKMYYLANAKQFKDGVQLINANHPDLLPILDKNLDQKVTLSGTLQTSQFGDSMLVIGVDGQTIVSADQAGAPIPKQLFADIFKSLTEKQQQCLSEKFGSDKLEQLKQLDAITFEKADTDVMVACVNTSDANAQK